MNLELDSEASGALRLPVLLTLLTLALGSARKAFGGPTAPIGNNAPIAKIAPGALISAIKFRL